MSLYFILYACSVMCAAPKPLDNHGGDAYVSSPTEVQAFLRACDPDLIITADQAIAEKALESNAAMVFRVSPKMKVFKLARTPTFHVDEVEQAAPGAPR